MRNTSCTARLFGADFEHNNCSGALKLESPPGKRIFKCSKCEWEHRVSTPNVIPIFDFYDNCVLTGEWKDTHECNEFCQEQTYATENY